MTPLILLPKLPLPNNAQTALTFCCALSSHFGGWSMICLHTAHIQTAPVLYLFGWKKGWTNFCFIQIRMEEMHPKTFFVLVHLKRGKLEKNENSLQLNFSSSIYRYRGCRCHSLSNRQRGISAATRTILRWECGWPGNPGRSLNLMFFSEFLVVGGKCWVK